MLEKFTVVDLIKTRSASIVTFLGNVVKFNTQTAAELRYPAFVQLLTNPKDKQFAVRVCKEDDPNALRFSKPQGEQIYQIKLTCPPAVDLVRKMAGWSNDDAWNVPGIFFASENAIVYDLSTAFAPKSKTGGRITANGSDTELTKE